MAGSNGNSSNWAMERRVEGLVNKHMADMALETLQQRLSAVSQEMNHLSAEISRREDTKRVEALPRRSDPHFIVGSLPESYTEELVDEKKKLMPNTATSSSSSSSSAGRRGAACSEVYSAAEPWPLKPLNLRSELFLEKDHREENRPLFLLIALVSLVKCHLK